MTEIMTLSDANFDAALGAGPALILFSDGSGLRGDFSTAFRKAAADASNVSFYRVDPTQNAQLAARFGIGDKPVLLAWYKTELVRRVRPWGSDVTLAVELVEKARREDPDAPQTNEEEEPIMMEKKKTPVNDKPVAVTDNTFQQEVLDYSHELPVLVDFWAEWCGPCRMVAPIMEKLAAEFAGQVRIAKVDTDHNPGLSGAFRIMSIPTIMAFKQGKLVFNQPGAFPEAAFRDLIQQLIALEIPADAPAEPSN